MTADDTAFLVAALASPILKMPLQPWVQETATSTMDEKNEFALIKMIADFIVVPIPYGKPLRRLRELHDALLSLLYS